MSWGDVVVGSSDGSFPKLNFWVKNETRRIMFLCNEPIVVALHNLKYAFNVNGVKRCMHHSYGQPCSFCNYNESAPQNGKSYPSKTAVFDLIELGVKVTNPQNPEQYRIDPVTYKDKQYQFSRKVLEARMGTSRKEGRAMMWKRKIEASCGPNIMGAIFDVEADGSNYIITFVDQVDEGSIRQYLINMGADPEVLDLEPTDWNHQYPDWTPEEANNIIYGTRRPMGGQVLGNGGWNQGGGWSQGGQQQGGNWGQSQQQGGGWSQGGQQQQGGWNQGGQQQQGGWNQGGGQQQQGGWNQGGGQQQQSFNPNYTNRAPQGGGKMGSVAVDVFSSGGGRLPMGGGVVNQPSKGATPAQGQSQGPPTQSSQQQQGGGWGQNNPPWGQPQSGDSDEDIPF